MPVRFLVGRSGSGKTRRCFDTIVSQMTDDPLGPPIHLIVPKQETFTRERELTCNSSLKGFCRTNVLSFELLGEKILAECGGTSMPQVTQLGRQMIIGHLLRTSGDQLGFYGSTARTPGLAAQLDRLFAEFERNGSGADEINALCGKIDADTADPALLAKCRDLSTLYTQYIQYLGQDRLDPQRRFERVQKCIRQSPCIKHSQVFIDGFLDFSHHERQMLIALAQTAAEVTITLTLDPESKVVRDPNLNSGEMELFSRTEQTFKRVLFDLRSRDIYPTIEKLTKIDRYANGSLRELESELCSQQHKPRSSVKGITLFEAADRRAEADAAARQLKAWAKSGIRYRDMAVFARTIDDYEELISATFTEHGVPFFIDRRRPAGHHPLIQLTRSLLQVGLHNWSHEALMSLLRTELASLDRKETDELENYVLLHRIAGSIWADRAAWSFHRVERRNDDETIMLMRSSDLDRINVLRDKAINPMRLFVERLSDGNRHRARDFTTLLFDTFKTFEVERKLLIWINEAEAANKIERRNEHHQTWTELMALLDEMVHVIGDTELTASEWVNILETGLDRLDLALAPPTLDTVIVGSIERARGNRPRAAIVLGLTDQQFPRAENDDSLLSDADRRTLEASEIELDISPAKQLLNERLLGYFALTRASEQLCLMRSLFNAASQPIGPSPFWQNVQAIFPSLKPIRLGDAKSLSWVGTERQLATALMAWARRGSPNDAWAPLYNWFATQNSEATQIARDRSWRALSYDNTATLARDTAARLTPLPLLASVSRIETFARCPYQHFARFGLKLTEREEDQITAVDIGNAYHTMLDQIVRNMIADRIDWNAAPTHQLRPTIEKLAETVGQDLRGELLLSSARNRFTLKTIERAVEQVMEAQVAAGSRGQLSPWRTELKFDVDDAELPALELKTSKGRTIQLRGRIDRVDRVAGEGLFAVYDYKLGGQQLSLQHVFHGLALQLLIYLTVLRHSGEQLSGAQLTPAAALYVKLRRDLESVKHPRDAVSPDDPAFNLQTKPRGIIDVQFVPVLDRSLAGPGRSEVVNVMIKQDHTIGNRERSDAAESDELAALLDLAEKKLLEMADLLIDGHIDVHPFKLGKQTPCAMCSFHAVCRFDRTTDRYRTLQTMSRQEVLAAVRHE